MLGGGASAGPAPKKFSSNWKTVFCACAFLTVFGAALGLWSTILSFPFGSPFDVIIFTYLILIGLIMAALDVPVQNGLVLKIRYQVSKYCKLTTRFIGRGIVYLFLGCILFGNLWDNATSPFLGFIIFCILGGVGVVSIAFGMVITRKLLFVRSALLNRGGPSANICPPNGLTMEKFGELCLKIQGVKFDADELGYICNALSQVPNGDNVISQAEFDYWLRNPTFVLI